MALRFLRDGYFVGKVGIGTASPSAKLHVDNNGASTTAVRFDAGATANAIVAYGNNGNKYFELGEVGSTDPGRMSLFNSGTQTILLRTDGNSFFNGGNVGIGIAAPTKTLNVEFNSSSVAVNTGEGLGGGTAGTGVLLRNSNTTVGTFANLDFRANNVDARIAVTYNATNNGDFHFILDNTAASPTTRLFIEGETGNVGIGTTSPGAKLEVAGDMNLYNPSNTSQINFRDISNSNYIKSNGYATHFGLRGNAGNGQFIIENNLDTNQDVRIKPTTGGWTIGTRGVAGVNALLEIDTVLNIYNKMG